MASLRVYAGGQRVSGFGHMADRGVRRPDGTYPAHYYAAYVLDPDGERDNFVAVFTPFSSCPIVDPPLVSANHNPRLPD